jgi:hypothetical protein
MHGITTLVVRLKQDGDTALRRNLSLAMTKASCGCYYEFSLFSIIVFDRLKIILQKVYVVK